LQDDNLRWDALMDFNATTPAWWEERPPSSFEGGRVIVGDSEANDIKGTRQADVLVGYDGDDVLRPLGGVRTRFSVATDLTQHFCRGGRRPINSPRSRAAFACAATLLTSKCAM
jgi:hypothetical protein